jgi:glycosyltransferase involved in cell wall biosynthesis
MSLRILHVIPSVSPWHGGPSFALPLFTNAITRQGAEVTVATTDDDGRGARLNVPLGEFVSGPGDARCIYFRKNTETYKVSLGLAQWLQRHVADYDAVHVHALFSFSSYAAARAARRGGVPYIVRPLGVLNRWSLENRRRLLKQWSLRLIELPILRGAAAIHYTAKAEQEEAASAHLDVAAIRSSIIPIPVEPAPVFDSSEAGKRFPVAAGRRVILFLSRLHVKKGIELLLPAFAQIHSEFPDALLVVAGSGEPAYVETLREKARALGCERDVFWPGFVAGDDKSALLVMATLFVLPSFSENFGIAAAEALAAGVPSILSDQVAIARDAASENAAVIVPCDTAALAAAMRQLLTDNARREELRQRGPAFIKNHFSPDAVGRELIALYQSVREKTEIECTT